MIWRAQAIMLALSCFLSLQGTSMASSPIQTEGASAPEGEMCGRYLRAITRLHSGDIDRGIMVRPGISLGTSFLKWLVYDKFMRQIHEADRQFVADEQCTRCGTCAGVCPVQNIVLVDEKPEWQHHCELCMACLNLCPVKAIQWTEKTKGRGRYRHPDLKIADMEAQRGEAPKEHSRT